MHDPHLRRGHVTLVGAGPGGADLITVRGARALAAADVVVHDRLVDAELLALAPERATMICVGKAKGVGESQEVINAVLIDHAGRGSHVVRLKGGDPFLFGRGSEEVDAMRGAGIAVTVVPGVTSAFGAPALAGIPVTHRDVAASVTVVSGHRAGSGDYDWDAIVRSGSTLVVLMAATTAASIAEALIAAGRAPGTPAAALHRAGTDHARSAVLSLADLAALGCPFPSPTVLVIGEVVGATVGLAGSRVTRRG